MVPAVLHVMEIMACFFLVTKNTKYYIELRLRKVRHAMMEFLRFYLLYFE